MTDKDDDSTSNGSSFSVVRMLSLGGAGAVCLILVIVGAVTIVQRYTGNGDSSSGGAGAATPAHTSSASRAPTGGNAHCDIAGGSTAIPHSSPKLRWVTKDRMKLPVSKQFGPGKRDSDGAWSCFGHSPTGAALAMITIARRMNTAHHWREVVRSQIYPEEGRQGALDNGTDPPAADLKNVGFKITAYSPREAKAQIVVRAAGKTYSCDAATAWKNGDWRLKAFADGSTSRTCSQNVPSHIVRF